MPVLVAYASKHGATQQIAERIAQTLTAAGQQARMCPVTAAGDLADCSAFVVGSAVYMGHWQKEAVEFVQRNRAVLADHPVWLFSSGPLGTEPTDAQGRDLKVTAEPKDITGFTEAIHPREHRVFFGVLDPARLAMASGRSGSCAAAPCCPRVTSVTGPRSGLAAGIARELTDDQVPRHEDLSLWPAAVGQRSVVR